MATKYRYDATVVGSGPNGLAAAVVMQKAGLRVKILEAKDTIGGGMRSAELTLPGFVHDICSAIHPLAAGSPYLSTLPLHKHGLEYIYPDISVSHPFDDGTSINVTRSINETADQLGEDGKAYRDLIQPFIESWSELSHEILGPLRIPKHPLLLAKFGLKALRSAKGLARSTFKTEKGRTLFAGMAAHCMLPLDTMTTSAIGLVLCVLAHTKGWPIVKGGSENIAKAMGSYFKAMGGEIETRCDVKGMSNIPSSRVILFDVTPRQLMQIMNDRLSKFYCFRLKRYRYGPGVFKMDWALKQQVPFTSEGARRAATLHLGGSLNEIEESEYKMNNGEVSEKPYVIFAQQTVLDKTRAPKDMHTAWAYCHAPSSTTKDLTKNIESQIERYAPGFKDTILRRHAMSPSDMQKYNPNYVGGDINGGVQDITQLFTRPVLKLSPYRTSAKGIYICSSSTPPGGGVHGMCGYYAAKQALKDEFNINIKLEQ